MFEIKEYMVKRMNKDERHVGKTINLVDFCFKINDVKLDNENKLISDIKFTDENNNMIILCLVNDKNVKEKSIKYLERENDCENGDGEGEGVKKGKNGIFYILFNFGLI